MRHEFLRDKMRTDAKASRQKGCIGWASILVLAVHLNERTRVGRAPTPSVLPSPNRSHCGVKGFVLREEGSFRYDVILGITYNIVSGICRKILGALARSLLKRISAPPRDDETPGARQLEQSSRLPRCVKIGLGMRC
jgi:hypothetical protein